MRKCFESSPAKSTPTRISVNFASLDASHSCFLNRSPSVLGSTCPFCFIFPPFSTFELALPFSPTGHSPPISLSRSIFLTCFLLLFPLNRWENHPLVFPVATPSTGHSLRGSSTLFRPSSSPVFVSFALIPLLSLQPTTPTVLRPLFFIFFFFFNLQSERHGRAFCIISFS